MICLDWILVVLWPYALLVRPRRHDPLRCARCGYTLLGNVSGICPECGTSRVLLPRDLHGGRVPGRWFAPAVLLLAGGLAVHAAFLMRYYPHILNPDNSPFGHENAFGDAPGMMHDWAMHLPLLLCTLSICAGIAAVVIARRRDLAALRPCLTLWAANAIFYHYLIVMYFAWFFD